MTNESKLKGLQTASVVMIAAILVLLMMHVYDYSSLSKTVVSQEVELESIREEMAGVPLLKDELDDMETALDSASRDLDTVRDHLQKERKTTDALRDDLKQAVSTMRSKP